VPTKAFEPLFDRKRAVALVEPVASVATPTLIEAVNFATVVAARSIEAARPEPDADVAAFVLFLNVIELADGIQVLIAQSATGPALAVGRSLLEATLFLEFILQADDGRSLAWLAEAVQTRISHLQTLDPIRKSDAKRRRRNNLPAPSKRERETSALTRREIASLQKFLRKPHMAGVLKKVAETRNWYQAYGGGATLEQLAGQLGRSQQYQVLYRSWTTAAHPLDIWRRIAVVNDTPAFWPLRDPRDAKSIASSACSLLLLAIRFMAIKYVPSLSYRDWYIREVRNAALGLARSSGDA
jgi:hypothetical protein